MKLRLENDGSIRLPAEVRSALGVSAGAEVSLSRVIGRSGCRIVPLQTDLPRMPLSASDSEKPADVGGLKAAIARKPADPMQLSRDWAEALRVAGQAAASGMRDALYLLPHP